MRIIQINSARKWIGEAAHTFLLFKELSKRNIFSLLICKEGWAIEENAKKENLPFIPLKLKSRFNIISDFKDFLRLRKIIKENKIDIIHTHRGKEHWLSALTVLTLKNKPKIIRTRHVITPIKQHIFNKWLFGTATDAIICTSKKIYERAKKTGLIKDENKIKVVYGGVDINKFSPKREKLVPDIFNLGLEEHQEEPTSYFRLNHHIPQSAILIGLVGRLQKIKGQEVFLNAAKIISENFSNTHFLIAGKGKEEKGKNLKNLANELSISDKITFLGYIDEVEEVIANLDIGVIASIGSEGSSRIAMEYMASGLPIVATNVGGIPEILSNGKYGILVESNSPKALAEGVITLLNNRQKMNELKKLAKERAEIYFNFDRWTNEIIEIYKNLL